MPRSFIFYLCITAIVCSRCTHTPSTTVSQIRCIGIQPLAPYDAQQAKYVQQQVHLFFNKPVIILGSISIPHSFANYEKGERYSADSIIAWLSKRTSDTLTAIIGLTHKDIYTTVKDPQGHIKQPAYKYGVWGIFGLGFQPGASCVISDHRLQTPDTAIFHHRLRTVVIHEAGHNLGLPHCPTVNCIMNDANEKIQTVDNSGATYCEHCRRLINL